MKPRDGKKFRAVTLGDANGINLTYTSKEGLTAEQVRSGEKLMLSDAEIDKSIGALPVGGQFKFTVYRSTIDAANTKYFTVIICDSTGKEILRQTGPNSIAEVPSDSTAGLWWNLFLIDLPQDIGKFADVYVVDTLTNERSHFRVLHD